MGMDDFHLWLEIERRFGIDLPDAVWQQCETVGELYFYLLGRVEDAAEPPADSAPCPTARAFYEARRAILDQTSRSRSQIRPTTPLTLLPRHRRKEMWMELARRLRSPLPDLAEAAWRRWLDRAIGSSLLLLPVAFGLIWWWRGALFGFVLAVLLLLVAATALGDLGHRPPEALGTVGDLARHAVKDRGHRTWPALQQCIAEVLEVEPAKVKQGRRLADLWS